MHVQCRMFSAVMRLCLCITHQIKSCMRRGNVMRLYTDCMKSLTHWPTSPFPPHNLHQNRVSESNREGGGVLITRRTRQSERMHVRTDCMREGCVLWEDIARAAVSRITLCLNCYWKSQWIKIMLLYIIVKPHPVCSGFNRVLHAHCCVNNASGYVHHLDLIHKRHNIVSFWVI